MSRRSPRPDPPGPEIAPAAAARPSRALVTIVLPCRNEEANLDELHARLDRVVTVPKNGRDERRMVFRCDRPDGAAPAAPTA